VPGQSIDIPQESVWNPSPTLAADMAKLLQGGDPEQFEMWVEELEDA
jgi:hypothetical protein